MWSKLAAPARRKQGKGQWASVAGSTQWRGEGHPSIPREVVGFPKLPESANSSRVLFSHGHLCSGSLPYGQPLGSAQAACSQNRPRLRNCKPSLSNDAARISPRVFFSCNVRRVVIEFFIEEAPPLYGVVLVGTFIIPSGGAFFNPKWL